MTRMCLSVCACVRAYNIVERQWIDKEPKIIWMLIYVDQKYISCTNTPRRIHGDEERHTETALQWLCWMHRMVIKHNFNQDSLTAKLFSFIFKIQWGKVLFVSTLNYFSCMMANGGVQEETATGTRRMNLNPIRYPIRHSTAMPTNTAPYICIARFTISW